jgi:hypothetical protein
MLRADKSQESTSTGPRRQDASIKHMSC